MGFVYTIRNQAPYFLTLTVVDWIDVFTRKEYRYLLTDSLRYCVQHKELVLHAWCLMSNHVHLIASMRDEANLSGVMRDFKKFTAKAITKAIAEEGYESRREWLLNRFAYRAAQDGRHKEYKLWQEGLHAEEISSPSFLQQKLDYIHFNPVTAAIVAEPEHYLFSSAIDYAGGKGLVEVVRVL